MSFYSKGYEASVPEVLTAPVAYHAVVLHRSLHGPCGEASGVLPAITPRWYLPSLLRPADALFHNRRSRTLANLGKEMVGHLVYHRQRATHDNDGKSTSELSVIVCSVDGDLSRRQPRRSAPAKSPLRTMVLSSREGRKEQERKEPVEGEGVVEGAQGTEVVGVELCSFTKQPQEQHLTTRGKSLEAQEHLPKVGTAVGKQRGNSGVICDVNMGERLLSL
ncbi:hypothetical protein B296_00005729 [Ensete ventricosum]|uniref:Uncharacterized protein n=1 Tax=Ensete ventricosum TaxID=4639 RepID=A0A426YD00_ENSVE|nr:hypothetical protein B296_00005729 [Ensete ventricosum]